MKPLEATEILLTTRDLAKLLNMPEGSIESGRSTGKFPIPYSKFGRRVRYRLCEVEVYIEANRRCHTSDGVMGSVAGKKPSNAISSIVNNGVDGHTEPKIAPPIPAPPGTTEIIQQEEDVKASRTMDKYQSGFRKEASRLLAKAKKEGRRPTNEIILEEVEYVVGEDRKTNKSGKRRSRLTRIRWISKEAEKLGMKSPRGRKSKKERQYGKK